MADDYNSVRTRLDRLLSYLEHDPDNLSLLAESAEAALAGGDPGLALTLLDRHADIRPLSPSALNTSGLAMLATGEYETAASIFAGLLERHPDDVSLRFNRAWALSMARLSDEALTLLDDATVLALPQAAVLHVQLLHRTGKLEEARESAKRHAQTHSAHSGFMAALSMAASDMQEFELATEFAELAGDHPDAITTLGLVALHHARDNEADEFFARALAVSEAPRARIGQGIVALMRGDAAVAADNLQTGAAIFGSHTTSWIAAGWANILARQLEDARRCFEKALSIDASAAESHGSLAVVAFLQRRNDDAEHLSEAASRLDARSFSAALAKTLLMEARTQPDLARHLVERALNTKLDENGATIARAIALRALLA